MFVLPSHTPQERHKDAMLTLSQALLPGKPKALGRVDDQNLGESGEHM